MYAGRFSDTRHPLEDAIHLTTVKHTEDNCTEMTMCGQFPSFAMTLSLSIVSWFPTTSSKT